MAHLNIEFKARFTAHDEARAQLREAGARLQGTDTQTDVYFDVPNGRLKLRYGPIENSLIQYNRQEQAGLKSSQVSLVTYPDEAIARTTAEVLAAALPVRVRVAKRREIWWLGNLKFHLDEVEGLGRFLELEAIDYDGTLGADHLTQQCQPWIQALGIAPADFVAASYSDLLLAASAK